MSEAKVADMGAIVEEVVSALKAGIVEQKGATKALRGKLSYTLNDLEGMTAAVHFIVTSSAKHDVDEVSLVQEIQQLGLSRESAEAICGPYQTSKEGIQQQLIASSHRLNRLAAVDWRIDDVLLSSDQKEDLGKVAVIKLDLQGGDRTVFNITKDRLDALIHELKQAQAVLNR